MTDGISGRETVASTVTSYAAMPLFTEAIRGTHAVVTRGGIKKAIKAQNHKGFKKLANAIDKDVFSKSLQIADEYGAYKDLVTKNAKLSRKATRIAKTGKLSVFDKIGNLFADEASKVTVKNVKSKAKDAAKQLNKADDALKSGKSVIEATTGVKAASKGFEETAKTMVKSELKSKLNIFFAGAFTFWPTFKNNAIPAFKNDGIIAGLKETAKALGFGAADLGLSAGATVLGGAIGAAIGSILPGAGTVIGRSAGSAIASLFVTNKISKAAEKSGKYTGQENNEQEISQQGEINQSEKEMGVRNASKLDNLYA